MKTWLSPTRQRALNAGGALGPRDFDFSAALRAVMDDETMTVGT